MAGAFISRLHSQPVWLRISESILFVIAVFVLNIAIGFPQQGSRYLLLFPAVVASAYFAGRPAGIAATVTAALLVTAYLGVTWGDEARTVVDLASLAMFIALGVGLSELFHRIRANMAALEEANRQLGEAHAKAQASEESTDLLLRELTHRTRNDIANVVSILRLQAKNEGDGGSKALSTAADRLQVLARVHQKLSRQGHSPTVELQAFLKDLTSDLRSTLLALRPVAVETDFIELELPARRAVPIGLIYNELLTNAVKYAYPGDREGTIRARLSADDETVTLEIIDDGIGIKPGRDGAGLGHRLVRSFTAQLGGSFECDSEQSGTNCRIRFPRNHIG